MGSIGSVVSFAVAVIAVWFAVRAAAWSSLGTVALFAVAGLFFGFFAWATWTAPRRIRIQFDKDGVRFIRPWRKAIAVPYGDIAKVGSSPFGALRIREKTAKKMHTFSLQWFSLNDAANIVAEFEARHIPVDRAMALATRAAYP